MGRPRLVEGQIETADRLLTAAEFRFSDQGFDGTKLGDIARDAGISRPSLLYHFGSKHALYCAVIQTVFDDLGRDLRAALAMQAGFSKQLDAVLSRFVGFVEGRPTAARLILREVLDARGPGHALLLSAGLPLLKMVERFIRQKGAARSGMTSRFMTHCSNWWQAPSLKRDRDR